MNREKYIEGTPMEQFTRIDGVSSYNYNYYIGFGSDLLFGKSDDDNTTEWWVVEDCNFYYLGESYCNNGELLHLIKGQLR